MTYVRGYTLVLLFFGAACGASHPSSAVGDDDAVMLDEDCQAYLDAYGACMRRLSPESPELAEGRQAGARAALARVSDPSALNKTCKTGLAQLRESCR